jgi:hypothetical protein
LAISMGVALIIATVDLESIREPLHEA